jgi:hypothetical protein
MLYINHFIKAIFIHIPKTGGSYIGPTLVKYYGFVCYLDVLHNRRPDHELICNKDKQEDLPIVLTNNNTYDNSFFNKYIGLLEYCKTSDYINEKCNMDIEKWANYTKFCFLRHPYDRFLSGWRHIKKVLDINIPLSLYIKKEANQLSDIEYGHLYMTQTKQIMNEKGECGVDIIGRFEQMEEDFRFILNKIGISKINHIIEKKNVSSHVNTNKLVTNNELIEKLNILFKDDFINFHYKPLINP